jgi:hypothetical protein
MEARKRIGPARESSLIRTCPRRIRDLGIAANHLSPWHFQWNVHVRSQSTSIGRAHLQLARSRGMSAHSPQNVREQALSAHWPATRHLPDQSANSNTIRFCHGLGNTTIPEHPRMSSFDPATVRQAVAEFTPRRPQKFQELSPAREVIVELRQKRASYRAIAELLTLHCLPISKTAVAAFCHEVLGEVVRPKRRPIRKRQPAPNNGNGHAPLPSSEPPSADTDPTNDSSGAETLAARPRGPRIAQVRMLNPKPA